MVCKRTGVSIKLYLQKHALAGFGLLAWFADPALGQESKDVGQGWEGGAWLLSCFVKYECWNVPGHQPCELVPVM